MRIKSALAIVCLGLLALTGNAWAVDNEASERCLKCHDEDHEKMNRTPHAVSADSRAPTCVTCHGPSATHVAKKGNQPPDRVFKGEDALRGDAASEVCLSCHERDSKRSHWATSAHPAADVSCGNCHKVHTNNDKVLAKATQAEVCYACHKQQRAEAQRPSRHPLAEGKMSCGDCHNVHGSVGAKLARRDSTNDTCYTCHAEKRGPFVHSHEPVTEDCAICHNPHGSTVFPMLKMRAPILCNQCHTPHVAGEIGAIGGASELGITGTSSGKNTTNIWQGRSCLNCHTQVHGSNNPSASNPTPHLLFR